MYTCILNNYDVLMQPYYIKGDWDYVCFTDDQDALSKATDGVWHMRKANCDIADPNLKQSLAQNTLPCTTPGV